MKVGCMLQARHKLPEFPYPNEPVDLPHVAEAVKKFSDEIDRARIATIYISEEQAKKIVDRLWPNKGLMGATCGQGFLIESAEQAEVVNEVLSPDSSINFDPERHQWMLQTWPE